MSHNMSDYESLFSGVLEDEDEIDSETGNEIEKENKNSKNEKNGNGVWRRRERPLLELKMVTLYRQPSWLIRITQYRQPC